VAAPSHSWFKASWIAPIVAVAALGLAYLLRPTLPPPVVTGVTQLTHDGEPKLFLPGEPPPPLVSDGSRIYFRHGLLAKAGVMQISTAGGETVPLQSPVQLFGGSDIAPNGSELLAAFAGPTRNNSGAAIWIIPVPGGEPRRVGNIIAQDAAFSSDGSGIYYSSESVIYTAGLDGSSPKKILATSGDPYWFQRWPSYAIQRV
jgi:hypothetical protein